MVNTYKGLSFNLRWIPSVLDNFKIRKIDINDGKVLLFSNGRETIKEDQQLIEKVYKIILESLNNIIAVAIEQTEDYLMENGYEGGAPYILNMRIGGLKLEVTSQVNDVHVKEVLEKLFNEIELEINKTK